jgi:short-subunit dehydrogenase
MFRPAVLLFQLPYHFDRTGVRVMVMCPGATDTNILSEAPRRMMREEWGEEVRKNLDEMLKQK